MNCIRSFAVFGTLVGLCINAFADIDTSRIITIESVPPKALEPAAPANPPAETRAPERSSIPEQPNTEIAKADPKPTEDPVTLYEQAVKYDRGTDVVQDLEKARDLYERAAALGHSDAQLNLGLMYSNGQGVTRNDRTAAQWIRKAAESGLTDAEYSLGLLYFEGRGVRRDPKESLVWYEKAARSGHAQAMNNLGVMYALGQGVERSTTDAYAWFAMSARAGNDEAANNRDLIAKEFSGDQSARAEERLAQLASTITIAN
jgi:TPR repeat protein